MRKKTIAAIFSVYFAICAVYGGARALTATKDSEEIVTVKETVSQQTETSAEESAVPDESSSAAETQSETRSRRRHNSFTETPSAADESGEETLSEDDDEDEQPSETVTAAPEPDVPTLDDYLRNLRCSGCRRNCSLANPRCMNGARKASQAESEYYSLYG